MYEEFGDNVFLSIMNQYTPMESVKEKYPELAVKVTEAEYDELVDYAISLGVENGFIQEGCFKNHIKKGNKYMEFKSLEITAEELAALDPSSYLLIDLRDEDAYEHGKIPGAIRLDPEEISEGDFSMFAEAAASSQKIILYCKYGIISEDLALLLRDKGYEAYHIAQGYGRWALEEIKREAANEEKREQVEKSLTKKVPQGPVQPFYQGNRPLQAGGGRR